MPDLREGQRVRFTFPAGAGLETDSATLKALLAVLAVAWPRRPSFGELAREVAKLLATSGAGVPAELEARLTTALFDLSARGVADFLVDCGLDCAVRPPATPGVDPVARTLATEGLAVSNRWHEDVPLDATARGLLARLGGPGARWDPADAVPLAALAAAGFLESSALG